jgi:transitional endoplasmic reticulum ATPase
MHESKVPVLYVKSFHSTSHSISSTDADHSDWAGDEAGIKSIFERARAEAPCLLVLEDLDSLITDMNRSFFLNEVDGIDGNDGLLLVCPVNPNLYVR